MGGGRLSQSFAVQSVRRASSSAIRMMMVIGDAAGPLRAKGTGFGSLERRNPARFIYLLAASFPAVSPAALLLPAARSTIQEVNK